MSDGVTSKNVDLNTMHGKYVDFYYNCGNHG